MIGKRIAALALSVALTAGMAPSAALATTSRDVTATGLETASAQLTTQATTNCVEGKYVISKADDADNYEVKIWDDGEKIAINPASMTLSATAYIPFSAYALTQGTDGGMSLDASINIASWNEAGDVRTWYDVCFKKADSAMRDGGSIDWWYYDDSLQDVTEEKPAFATFEKVGDFIKVTYTDVPVDVNGGIQMGSFNTKTGEFNEGPATLSDIPAADYSYAIRFRLDGWKISDSGDFYITEIKLNSGSATYTKDLSGTNAVGALIHGDDEGTELYPTTFDPDAHAWDSGVVTTAATFDKTGVKTYTCAVCGETKTETIAKIKAVSLSKSSLTYTGKVQKPSVTVTDGNGKAIAASSYAVTYSNASSQNAGSYKVTVDFKGDYSGSKTLNYKIAEAANPVKVKVSSKTYKRTALKKAKSFSIGTTKAQGKVTYTLASKAKKAKIKVSSKGKVTIPKNCKKGTYKITVKAAGNENYKAKTATVTIKIK